MQKKTNSKENPVRGFRPEMDVEKGLQSAAESGMNISALCNLALREFLLKKGWIGK